MSWYIEAIESIKTKKSKAKERAISDLWLKLGEISTIDGKLRFYIRDNLLAIYPTLNFDQKHMALQVFLKLGFGIEVRELIFDYLGDIYEKFHGIAGAMSNYYYVMNNFTDYKNSENDFGPWDLDYIFLHTRQMLKDGGYSFA